MSYIHSWKATSANLIDSLSCMHLHMSWRVEDLSCQEGQFQGIPLGKDHAQFTYIHHKSMYFCLAFSSLKKTFYFNSTLAAMSGPSAKWDPSAASRAAKKPSPSWCLRMGWTWLREPNGFTWSNRTFQGWLGGLTASRFVLNISRVRTWFLGPSLTTRARLRLR